MNLLYIWIFLSRICIAAFMIFGVVFLDIIRSHDLFCIMKLQGSTHSEDYEVIFYYQKDFS